MTGFNMEITFDLGTSEVAKAPLALPPLAELLAQAGFRVRTARRADCPSCTGRSRMTVAFIGEVYFCHRCKRTGSRESLARELGLLATDQESVIRRRIEARERARLRSVAARPRAAAPQLHARPNAN